jgi:hypothetical protein
MNQPCPRHGCPGIITDTHRVKGFTHCSSMCGWLVENRERLITRLEKAETDSKYPSAPVFLVRECELLDLVELALDEYLRQHIRNVPRLWRARQELDWQAEEQAA